MGRFLALIMLVGALVGFTAAPSLAHTGVLSGTTVCNTDGTWSVKVKVEITNTPSDDTAETKAITASSGTLSKAGGSGVMAGSQVYLNAWYEHRNNWPGVKYRTGNWVDYYTIENIPNNVSSVSTMVQVDWKKWESRDYTKTFTKPADCKPAKPADDQESRFVSDEPDCTNLTVTTYTQVRSRSYYWANNKWNAGMWSDWTTTATNTRSATMQECPPPPQPPADVETRTVTGNPDCTSKTVTTLTQQRTRTYTLQGRTWVVGAWSDWTTTNTSTRPTTEAECPTPPPPPVTPPVMDSGKEVENRTVTTGGTCKQPQFVLLKQERSRTWTSVDGVRTYTAWTAWTTTGKIYPRSPVKKDCAKKIPPRITVIDNCRCKNDHVKVTGKNIAFKSVRQNKFVFTIRLVAKPGTLLPVDFKHPGKGWAKSVKYVVKTTNTPCPCPPGKKCAPKPKPPVAPCVRLCR